MRPTFRLYSGLFAMSLVSGTVGCGDTSAPKSSAQRHPASSLQLADGSTSTTTFIYSPGSPQVFNLGKGHKIFFDANAVCDPATSTYGPTEWDQPCEALTTPIAFTAVASTNEYGRPRVDFSPSVRFVPDSYVVLYLKDWSAAADSSTTIQWCPDEGECVDEEEQLVAFGRGKSTKHDDKNGLVFRLIKHFSGYNISVGRTLEVNIE
jgi:hypothetical protein